MSRAPFALALLLLPGVALAQTPEQDPRAALIAMGDAIRALRSYEADIERVTEAAEPNASPETVVTRVHLAIARPNRLRSVSTRPEDRMGVVCDGQRLVAWSESLGAGFEQPAPATLAAIDEATDGLAAEGLAIGGMLLAEDPVGALIQDFERIHDLGQSDLEGRRCRLVGLERTNGLRLVLWLDIETWLPVRATVDASATLRDMLSSLNIRSTGTQVTVTETHRAVRVNPSDLVFEAVLPEGVALRASGEAASPESL